MKLPYTADHARRQTVQIRIRKDLADLLREYAKNQHTTRSKMLDRIFQSGVQEWEKQKILEDVKN